MPEIFSIPDLGEARLSLKEYDDMREEIRRLKEREQELTDMLDHVCEENKVRVRRQIIRSRELTANPRACGQQEIIDDRSINTLVNGSGSKASPCPEPFKKKTKRLKATSDMKKIMFNDKYGLTEAVLSGRKTMTRRIIPPIEIDWNRRGKVVLPVSGFRHGCLWMDCREFLPDSGEFDYVAPQKYQPLYSIGEEVAIAQRYRDIRDIIGDIHDGKSIKFMPGWSNKMFVSADLMPHRIRITGIKTERLQDISDEDCLREGVEKWINCYIVAGIMEHGGKNNATFDTPRQAFASLIDKTCGKGTWQRNPWTWNYEFELIK